jgi:hypothetical protein
VLVSCVDLDSLGSGAPDSAVAEAGVPDVRDPCLHVAPPEAPGVDDSPNDELPPFVLALDEVALDPERSTAYDLDGVCTCDSRPGSAADGGPSCGSPKVTCDRDGGGDNAIGEVASTASPLVAIESTSNNLIAAGHRTLLLAISNYNGRANDREVVVGALLAEGIRSAGCPSSVPEGQTGFWSKGGCGDDPWTISPDAVVVTATRGTLPITVGRGFVRDYQLVVRFGDAARVPVNDEAVIRFGEPLLTGTLVPLDEALAPRDPTRAPTPREQRLFRIDRGVLAGRMATRDVLGALGTYRTNGGKTPVCASSAFESIRSIICQSADIRRAPAPAEPATRCDALSASMAFAAIPAIGVDVGDAGVVSTACATVDAAVFDCP